MRCPAHDAPACARRARLGVAPSSATGCRRDKVSASARGDGGPASWPRCWARAQQHGEEIHLSLTAAETALTRATRCPHESNKTQPHRLRN